MNEEQYFAAAVNYADALLHDTSLTDRQRVQIAHESITSHLPSQASLESLVEALAQFQEIYEQDVDAAQQIAALQLRQPEMAKVEEPATRVAALAMVVHSLLNLDATRSQE